MAKERFKVLGWKFGANKMHKRLLTEECSSLKTQVGKVEGTIKETLEFMEKLQADLDTALASNLGLKGQTKSFEDQVALLQH